MITEQLNAIRDQLMSVEFVQKIASYHKLSARDFERLVQIDEALKTAIQEVELYEQAFKRTEKR